MQRFVRWLSLLALPPVFLPDLQELRINPTNSNLKDIDMSQCPQRTKEQGNALFLILIAVVLFAALTYAITQSGRGGGDVGRETHQITGTALTQYTTSIRTAITRMLIRGIAVDELKFDPPHATAYEVSADVRYQVFHPDGGGVGYQKPEATV